MFTIDKSYNIKAVLNSLPHVIYSCDSLKTGYNNTLIRKDFEKWRSGNYDLQFSTNDTLIINENNRNYIFTLANNISTSEILWLLFDELQSTNKKIDNFNLQEDKKINIAHDNNKISLLSIDYKISTLKINLNEFNDFLSEFCNYVIGVRGYWLDNTFITFNITQILCLDDRKFEPFVDIKLINTKSTVPDENSYITAHDLLSSFSNVSLRFYCKENNIMINDLNKFISKSANAYFEGVETSMNKELTKKFFNTSDFSLEHKTSIIIDLTDLKCFDQLNKFMEIRNMQFIDGKGYWINPLSFKITKMVFKTLSDDDEFEKIDDINNISEKKDKISPKLIKQIEKTYHKNHSPDKIIIWCDNTTCLQYNLHLLVTFE
jgi:hypothetical protein